MLITIKVKACFFIFSAGRACNVGAQDYNDDPSVAGWSSLVARRAHNPKVVGSNPAPASNKILIRKPLSTRAFLLPKFKHGG